MNASLFHCRDRLIEYAVAIAHPIEPAQEMAEEAVHDVFVGLWKRRDQTWLHGTMAQYLFGAVRKRMLSTIAQERRQSLSRDDDALDTVAITPDFAEHLVAMDLEQALFTMLTAVTDREETVFLLRVCEQMSYREIADQLHISPKTVRVHFARARRTLEPLLRSWLTDQGQ